MEAAVDDKAIKELAKKLAKDLKTDKDLNVLSRALKKVAVEAALEAEMDEHLGYEKHAVKGNGTGNSRNGKSAKRLKGDHGDVQIDVPRDRNSKFEPKLIKKGQSRVTEMDDQILFLYAKGMSTREIADTFKEMYSADVSPALISRVTDRVIERVNEWQHRSLDAIYPIVYLDCIVLKIRQNQRVINKSMYLALGVNLEGHKELLGLWLVLSLYFCRP